MKKFWILAAFAAMFASCSNDQDTPSSVEAKGDTELKIGGSANELVVTKANVNLLANTKIGVFAYIKTGTKATTLETTSFKNVEYSAKGTDATFTALKPINLWHENTYHAIAYSPKVATISDATKVDFVHGNDVMYASEAAIAIAEVTPATTPATYTASTDFLFKHVVSQINFAVKEGVGMVAADLANATLSATGFFGKCTMDLNTGKITPTAIVATDATTQATITEKDKAICFIPNGTDMTLDIKVILADGRECNGTLKVAFAAGSSYKYTIVVNKNDSKLVITGQVVDWTVVDGGDVPIEG